MKVSVFVKDPGKKPRHVFIEDNLKNLQRTVDGYIEVFQVTSNIAIVCNEEGLINNLPYNCSVHGNMFFGTIFWIGTNEEEFTHVPISWDSFKKIYSDLFDDKNNYGGKE